MLLEGMKIFACDHDANFQGDRVVKDTPVDFHTLKRLRPRLYGEKLSRARGSPS